MTTYENDRTYSGVSLHTTNRQSNYQDGAGTTDSDLDVTNLDLTIDRQTF